MSVKTKIGLALVLCVGLAIFFWNYSSSTDPDPPQGALEQVREPKLSGVVLDRWSQPIAGATLTLSGNGVEQKTTSTPDGSYAFDDFPEVGEVTLRAEHPDFVVPGPGDLGSMRIVLTQSVMPNVAVVMRKTGSVSGRVVAGNRAVPASVGVSYSQAEGLGGPTGPFSMDAMTSTDGQGRFALGELAPGQLRVFVNSEAYAYTESREINLEDEESITDLVIDLAPGALLGGSVLNTQGQPITNAAILVSGKRLDRPRRVVSSADGTYRAESIPLGEVEVHVSAPGYASEKLVLEIEGGLPPVDFVLDKANGYFGKVVRPDGSTTNPVWIYGLPKIAVNHATGTFDLPIEGAIEPKELNFISPFHPPHKQVVQPGEETVITLSEGGFVEGIVVDTSGRPLQNARVAVTGLDVEQPAPYMATIFPSVDIRHGEGEFRYGPLRPGRYTLGAQAPGLGRGETRLISVQADRTTRGVRIEIAGGGSVSGVVRTSTGQPVHRARVDLFEPQSSFRVASVFSDEQGQFKMDGIPAGRRSLRVSARGFMSTLAGGLTVSAGQNTRADVVLEQQEAGAQFQFSGIGAILQNTPQGTVVMDLMDGHPAELHGLKKGDIILNVDGEPAVDLRLDSIVELIRGQDGVPVTLELDRPGAGRQRIEIQRGKVVVRSQSR